MAAWPPLLEKEMNLSQKLVSIFFAAVFFFCSQGYGQSCELTISDKLNVASWARFEREPLKFGAVALSLETMQIRNVLHLKDRPDVRVGSINAIWEGKPHRLYIDLIRVEEPFKKMGVGTYLIESLMEQFPIEQVEEITAVLAMDNLRAFMGKFNKSTNNFDEALKQTPFYKSFSRVGFSEVVNDETSYKPEDNLLKITLTKPIRMNEAPFELTFKPIRKIILINE